MGGDPVPDERALVFGFQDAREEVVADLDEPRTFCRVNDQDGTTGTGLSELHRLADRLGGSQSSH
ncbi:hypothetical protein AMK33_01385 [Streptomyces sp. CB02400]|nr:hypothetical protein AMK33_01385 [Streptomyces sp. CB02400]